VGATTTWLFSARVDLAVFLGSFAVAMLALPLGALTGDLNGDQPDWAWIPTVLMVDVAHVWATGFRTYFDRAELARRPVLLAAVPSAALLAGALLYHAGAMVFWRTLAYLAILHFVRQQYGWVALYRARAGETRGKVVDFAAVYAATLYPLLYWHTHLPRRFDWFVKGDVVELPAALDRVGRAIYVVAMAAYVGRSAHGWIVRRRGSAGKDVVVATTAIAWLVGIVVFDSDYAFTVTNVLIHGIPYFALVFLVTRSRPRAAGVGAVFGRKLVAFLGLLWAVAFLEEALWDRGVWHERAWLFGAAWEGAAPFRSLLVPLLAVPQITHYVLDGVLWRRRANPEVASLVGHAAAPTS
jgi:hypothetical protein